MLLGTAAGPVGSLARPTIFREICRNLWKNADAEIPMLEQARTEYARLRQPASFMVEVRPFVIHVPQDIWRPRLSVAPGRRRRAQREDGRDKRPSPFVIATQPPKPNDVGVTTPAIVILTSLRGTLTFRTCSPEFFVHP